MDDPRVLRALAEPAARVAILEVLRRAVDRLTLEDQADVAPDRPPRLLSETRPFLWSKEVASAERSVFSNQPCDSGLEVRFVGFADRCPDVAAFAKLAPASRISMEYRNEDGRMAFYYPDFVVRMVEGDHYLIETKGHADLDVPAKDRRAAQWALDATMVSGVRWQYLRVDERPFDEHASGSRTFEDLLDVVRARQRALRLSEVRPGGKRSPEELLDLMEKVSERTSSDPPDVDADLRAFRERGDG
jgi:type III restriction enzyme